MFLYIKKNKHTSILQNSNSKISEYDENVYKNCHMIQFDSEILKRNWKVVSNPILPKNTPTANQPYDVDRSFRSSPFQKYPSNSKYNAALHN